MSTSPLLFNLWKFNKDVTAPPPAVQNGRISEADFEAALRDELSSDGVRASAWRAARSDHRLIVQAILTCKGKLGDIIQMPVATFSTFLLDLMPNGSHALPITAATGSDADPASLLSPAEHILLSLSDSISRARLLSVEDLNYNLTYSNWLSGIALGVSFLATFFVAWQARMRPPPDAAQAPPSPSTQTPEAAKSGTSPAPSSGAARSSSTGSTFYDFVSIAAIFLSILGTTLVGVKGFFDPTRALVQNELALRELRKLHQEIVLAVACRPGKDGPATIAVGDPDSTHQENMKKWTTRVAQLQAEIIKPYAAKVGSLGQGGGGGA